MSEAMIEPIQAGHVIRDKYRVERVLGQGGMGIVLAAMHVGLDQRVALKILKPELRALPEVMERFSREARAASKMEGAHVARVLDVDTLEDGTPFFVMEYLEGADLSGIRRTGRPLPPAEAVGYVIEACDALAEAHALGIIHRDLKPANLFAAKKRSGKTEIKVLDFGISKVGGAGDPDSGLTGTAVAMGSAEYMAPEQMLDARGVDVRADVWSLGVILYELCTARGPFAGASMGDTCARVIHAAPVPPRSIVPVMPAGLEQVILRCLDKDRTRRYPDVALLAAALAPFAGAAAPALSASSAVLPRIAPPSAHAPAPRPSPPPDPPRTIQPPAARPTVSLPIVAAAVAIGIGVVLAAFVLGRGNAESTAPTAPSASATPRPAPSAPASGRRGLFPSPGR